MLPKQHCTIKNVSCATNQGREVIKITVTAVIYSYNKNQELQLGIIKFNYRLIYH